MNLGAEKQKLLLEYVFSNSVLYNKSRNILKPEFFELPYNEVVNFSHGYFDKYGNIPSFDIIEVETGVLLESKELTEEKVSYVLDEVEKFCKNVAFRKAILQSAEEIAEGFLENAEERVRQSLSISIDNDIGLNPFEKVGERIVEAEIMTEPVNIGWDEYDKYTNQTRRGELNIITGNSGSGKSVFLTNIGASFVRRGYDVVYFSLELGQYLVAKRLDSILSGIPIANLDERVDELTEFYDRVKDSYGRFTIKKMDSFVTVSDMKSYLFDYSLQLDKVPDVIIIDHLDLMAPLTTNVVNGAFDRDDLISKQMRSLFEEYNSYGFTASQLNRDAVDVTRKSQAHIAGGISKINNSDITAAISKSDEQIRDGLVELQFLKLRNASMKVKPVILKWNDENLRITNPSETEVKAFNERNESQIPVNETDSLKSLLTKVQKKRTPKK